MTNSRTFNSSLVFAFSLILLVGSAISTMAQTLTPHASTPTALSETQGSTTGLGSSHRFKTAAAASVHCSNDAVVWSTGPNLTYRLSNAPLYGKGAGFYACKAEADDAGFHAAKD